MYVRMLSDRQLTVAPNLKLCGPITSHLALQLSLVKLTIRVNICECAIGNGNCCAAPQALAGILNATTPTRHMTYEGLQADAQVRLLVAYMRLTRVRLTRVRLTRAHALRGIHRVLFLVYFSMVAFPSLKSRICVALRL